MILDNVSQSADLIVETTSFFYANSFGKGDLDVIDKVFIPNRLEDFIGKAQSQNILDLIFGPRQSHSRRAFR